MGRVMMFEAMILFLFFLLMWLTVNSEALSAFSAAVVEVLKDVGRPAPYG